MNTRSGRGGDANSDQYSSEQDLEHIDLEEMGLMDQNRFVGQIPKYEAKHLRHYLTDAEQYEQNQPSERDLSQASKQFEQKIRGQIEKMALRDRLEITLETVPELAENMEEMRQDSLKYKVLMNRLNGVEMSDIVSQIMELQQKPSNASLLA